MSARPWVVVTWLVVCLLTAKGLAADEPGWPSAQMRCTDWLRIPMGVTSRAATAVSSLWRWGRWGRENRELRATLARLSLRVAQLEESAEENVRLRQLVGLQATIVAETIAARVIARDVQQWSQSLIIDRGAADGVSARAPVLAGGGVIGRVIEQGQHTSRIGLLTDPNVQLSGIHQQSRAVGLVRGTVEGSVVMEFVEFSADMQPGDVVVTAGLGRVFPKGLPIGIVIDVRVDSSGLFHSATLKPVGQIHVPEEVLCLRLDTPES